MTTGQVCTGGVYDFFTAVDKGVRFDGLVTQNALLH